jgi:hypothetical protein
LVTRWVQTRCWNWLKKGSVFICGPSCFGSKFPAQLNALHCTQVITETLWGTVKTSVLVKFSLSSSCSPSKNNWIPEFTSDTWAESKTGNWPTPLGAETPNAPKTAWTQYLIIFANRTLPGQRGVPKLFALPLNLLLLIPEGLFVCHPFSYIPIIHHRICTKTLGSKGETFVCFPVPILDSRGNLDAILRALVD